MLPKFLTIAQVARMKDRSRTSVYNAVNNGTLPSTTVMGRTAIKESDAKKWKPPGRIGRPKGISVKAETKEQISQSQKKRWAKRKRSSRK